MSGGTELVIFYGPPFIVSISLHCCLLACIFSIIRLFNVTFFISKGKTLHYVQNYSKTHCRISASEVFKKDKCSNLRLVVLKVIEVLRQVKIREICKHV